MELRNSTAIAMNLTRKLLALAALFATISLTHGAEPKRLLLVTISTGFRHSSIEVTEKMLRELAAKSGDFVVIADSDHPDYPDYSPSAGGNRAGDEAWGSPFGPQLLDGTPGQQAFIRKLNDRASSPLSPLEFSIRDAQAAVTKAWQTQPSNPATITARLEDLRKAELALALAKGRYLEILQASDNRLTPQQLRVLSGKEPSAPAPRTTFAPQVGVATPLQQKAIAAANASQRFIDLLAAATTARTELVNASFAEPGGAAGLNTKIAALAAAERNLATARADELARIEASAGRFAPNVLKTLVSRSLMRETGNAQTDGGVKVFADMLNPGALKNYDGVFFASTVGTLPFPDLNGFYDWVRNGGAWLGNHASSDSMHGTASYFDMMGGEFTGHGSQTTEEMVVMDPDHPIGAALGVKTLTVRDEMYTFENANFDFSKVHTILSFTKAMNDGMHTPVGAAGQWPSVWVKNYGKGRVFYSALGHREDVVDPVLTVNSETERRNSPEVAQAYQRMILQGVRWALGIIPGDATPQIKAPTPAGGPDVVRGGRGGAPRAGAPVPAAPAAAPAPRAGQ